MRNSYKKWIVIVLSTYLYYPVFGQQTPVFSDYNYNTVIINPAHAGFYPNTDVTVTNRGYLNQIDGSPRNIGMTINTTVNSKNVGLGIGVISDQVGVTTTTSVFGSYAYKIFFDHHYNRARWWEYNPNVISFGITGGVLLYNEDLLSLGIQGDPNFSDNINTAVPTLGIGFLYNRNRIYAGISATNVLGSSLASEDNINLESPVYAYAGYRLFMTRFEQVLIKPNMLLKYVSGAPLQADLNVTVNYKNKFEVGAGYRTSSSINMSAGFFAFRHWRLLFNYNFSIGNTPINNTLGMVLNYRFGEGFERK